MRLSGIHIYPIKGCRGTTLTSSTLDPLGLVGDRRFLIIDEAGKFITQRSHPQLALITVELTTTHLLLSVPRNYPVSIPLFASPPNREIRATVWRSTDLITEDCGESPAELLSQFLHQPTRLVRIGTRYSRPILKPTARPGDHVSFADAFPFLVTSEASLADLNSQLDTPITMDRFRPNLVLTDCEPYAEDTLAHFRIGDATFRAAGHCARCIVTTTDQATALRTGPEPLKTLATYRRSSSDPTDVNFGQNLIAETPHATLRIGDPLVPLPAN